MYAPGTKSPGVTKSVYTDQQYRALDDLMIPNRLPRVVKPEFLNAMLLPNGEVRRDAGKAIRAAVQNHPREAEIIEHLDQGRFLFVVDTAGVPVIYLQVGVRGNADAKPYKTEEPKAGRVRKAKTTRRRT